VPHTGTSPLLLEHGYVLTLDDDRNRGDLSILIDDGRIAAIDERAILRRAFPRAQRVNCRGRIIMPGLVNAHLHPDLQVLKGALEQRSLHDWSSAAEFNAAVTMLGSNAARDIQRISVRAALAECALGGTTTVGTYAVSNGGDTVCADALRDIGLRGAVTVRDVDFAPASFDGVSHFYRLHAEEALFPLELRAAAAAHARGERIVMHAAETEQRLAIARRRFGMTTIHLLHKYGLLSPRMLLSHAIHIDADEIDLIARSNARVVVSPSAEMKLSDGIPPVQALLERGITVALGTDAAVCNNSNDMFLEMRSLGLVQKLRYGPQAAPAEQILLMATRHGAAALGLHDTGYLAPGMAADLIAVDAEGPRLQPLLTEGPHENVASNLVFAATAADVTDVMVAGRWIVRRRRLMTLDTRALWQDLADAGRALDARLTLVT
jgi:5-methylthioadenosine/S-adenosylhomocysteine deaminase